MVAVLPEPPLLVPELATGVSPETAALRAACVEAAARLAAAAPRWIAVGSDEGGRCTVHPDVRGSFQGFGVDVVVALDPAAAGPPDPRLPLPLLVAGWAAGTAGAAVRIRGELLAPDAPAGECADLGAALAEECAADPEPVGLLVLGDGGRDGELAARTAAALGSADRQALTGLDGVAAGAPDATGRAPWLVLAAATRDGRWRGELLHSSAPFGVAYHVAVWTPDARA
jgi:hypothetical protein